MVRAASDDVDDPLALACFPMVPYVNRIARGHVRWRGETFVLPRNFGDHPHPLHGVGWRARWTCMEASQTHAVLTLGHDADDAWPWRMAMTQTFTLGADALTIALGVTNADARPMPAALGLHPYFPAGARVRLNAALQVLTGEDAIPSGLAHTRAVEALARGVRVDALALDHCFSGWDGIADIVWEDRALRLVASPSPGFVQVYTPAGADMFCIEPQSAMPDAIGRAQGGVVELAPGETHSLTAAFVVAPRTRA